MMIIKTLKMDEKSRYITLGIDTDKGYICYKISEDFYFDIGAPEIGASLSFDTLNLIEEEHEQYLALKKSLDLLAFSDNSEQQMYRKLLMRGIKKDAARFAVRRCVSLGYISEERQLLRLIPSLANNSLLGKERIVLKLAAKGYSPTDVYKIIGQLEESGDIDFDENKKKLIEKKLGSDFSQEDAAKLLYKYGF